VTAQILGKLGKWVPHRLSDKNKADRVRIATKLLEDYRSGELDDIVTADEKWVLYANIRRKRELMPEGETITAEVYCEQLDRVQEPMKERRPQRERVVFLHDNATPHTAKKTKRKIMCLHWLVLPHPPYSPNMAPTDFKLFLSLHVCRFLDTSRCLC